MASLVQNVKKWLGFRAKMSVQPSIEVIKETESTRTVPVKRDGQEAEEAEIQIYTAMLGLSFSSGRFGQDPLILLYDPVTGLFGWDFMLWRINISANRKKAVLIESGEIESTVDSFLDCSYIYLSKTQLIYLSLYSLTIRFRKFSERSATLDEARQQVFDFLEPQLDKLEKILVDWRQKIRLRKNFMDSSFFTNRNSMDIVTIPIR